jgi:O-antigen ligase
LACALLLIAPLIRGGNRQISLIVLLALGLLLLAVLGAERTYSRLPILKIDNSKRLNGLISNWRTVLLVTLICSPLWLGLMYLVPIPLDLWLSISGREFYFQMLQTMQLVVPGSFSLSLTPAATWASVLAGVPIVAMFVVAQRLPMTAIKSLLLVLLAVATLQVLLSVLQLVYGLGSIFYFDVTGTGSIVGSFANRNHLADLLTMSLPVCMYVFFDQTKKKSTRKSASLIEPRKQVILPFLLFLGLSFLLVLLMTLSRGGIISGFIALGASIWIYLAALGSKASGRQRLAYLGLSGVFIALATLAFSLDGIQARLGERFLIDAEVRNAIARATVSAASQFWPWGSGLGSFEAVFPRFQPAISIGYVEYAHNDYVQFVMELGVAGVVLMAIFAILLSHQVLTFFRIYRTEHRLPNNVAMQSFCGVGLLAFLLHSWVDFNMHIPALAIIAAFLTGVFLRNPELNRSR